MFCDDREGIKISIYSGLLTYSILATKDALTLNRLCSFWQNIVIKSSNKYYKKLLCFKNTFKVDIFNMDVFLKSDNIPCNYMFDYIIKRLKNEYPNDIATYDELIDQLYFTIGQNSSKQVNQSKVELVKQIPNMNNHIYKSKNKLYEIDINGTVTQIII